MSRRRSITEVFRMASVAKSGSSQWTYDKRVIRSVSPYAYGSVAARIREVSKRAWCGCVRMGS
ncbi:MAG: hypothetical protein ACK5OB_07235 [Pirellula sp.]